MYGLEQAKEKILYNKYLLECTIDKLWVSIANTVPSDYETLNKLHNTRKTTTLKLISLNKKLETFEQDYCSSTKIVKKRIEKYKPTYWYQYYPHVLTEVAMVLVGRCAEKSEFLKNKVKYSNWYYHIANKTGGSVLRYELEADTELHDTALQLAAMFSSFWRSELLQVSISYCEAQCVVVKGLKKGAFLLKPPVKHKRIGVFLPLYYHVDKAIVTFSTTQIFLGYIVKNSENDLVAQVDAFLQKKGYYTHLQNITRWIPSCGALVDENYKSL